MNVIPRHTPGAKMIKYIINMNYYHLKQINQLINSNEIVLLNVKDLQSVKYQLLNSILETSINMRKEYFKELNVTHVIFNTDKSLIVHTIKILIHKYFQRVQLRDGSVGHSILGPQLC
jgi:hypothetical protein